jgi:hypothetical protein
MTAVHPEASRQAVVEAALVLLERMGLSPADLAAIPHDREPVPTSAAYVPVVSAAVSAGTRRAYGSYWNRILEHWGGRRLDEPTPSKIRQLMAYVKTHVVARRNARGGRSAEEHLVAALRCLYKRAVDDGLIAEADNPARKVAKPRRLPTTRRALPDNRLAQINEIAATTGDDPELDALILRLHSETACRRGGALALRLRDLDPDQFLVLLRENRSRCCARFVPTVLRCYVWRVSLSGRASNEHEAHRRSSWHCPGTGCVRLVRTEQVPRGGVRGAETDSCATAGRHRRQCRHPGRGSADGLAGDCA